jgi:hypothetical protein
MEFALRLVRAFWRIHLKLRDIIDLRQIKDMQMLNIIMEFALRMVKVFR